jgi:hypothetical protein
MGKQAPPGGMTLETARMLLLCGGDRVKSLDGSAGSLLSEGLCLLLGPVVSCGPVAEVRLPATRPPGDIPGIHQILPVAILNTQAPNSLSCSGSCLYPDKKDL